MSSPLVLRAPSTQDGMLVYQLINQCPPLDTNSSYCNFLQCTHFAKTSVIAELGSTVVGFISAYRLPETPNILFIWQVAVNEQARGQGLAAKMIRHILERPINHAVSAIETTITEANRASWALFEKFAISLNAEFNTYPFLDKDKHFNGEHDSETLIRIGPFNHT